MFLVLGAFLYMNECSEACTVEYKQDTLACDQVYDRREDRLGWRLCLNDADNIYMECRHECFKEELDEIK